MELPARSLRLARLDGAPAPELRAPVESKAAIEPRPPVVLTVGELTQRIKGALETRFNRVLVRGEISGYRPPNARGHLYFSLKDSDACIDVCVWASTAQRMRFKLRDGLSVVIEGSVDVYAPRGRYSLIVQRIEPEGEGALALAFQQLKERLTQEGLMGENRLRPPRPLPFLPQRIGVVTSRTGAALQDFLRVLHGRHPRLSVLVADARVQGEGSADDVCRALKRLARTDVDVIVVTRGGGSQEDLWTFNEESVARAIHASPVPVVSAIGHEIDFTIADFVADFRAATPSAAAERLAPVLSELEWALKTIEVRLQRGIKHAVLHERNALRALSAQVPDLRRKLSAERHWMSDIADQLGARGRAVVRLARETLHTQRARLQALQPQTRVRTQRQKLQRLADRLTAAMRVELARSQDSLHRQQIKLTESSPRQGLAEARQTLGVFRARLPALVARRAASGRAELGELGARLNAMSPLGVMARGYSLTLRERDGQLVRRASDVVVGDRLSIRLADKAHTLDECQTVQAVVTGAKGGRAGLD